MPYSAASDRYANFNGRPLPTDSADMAVAVTPNDSTDLTTYARALYIGGAGNVVLLPAKNADGATVTLAVVAGAYILINTRRVLSTGTTATGIVALL